ncbi:MAG TPA: hypothetical protein VMV68_05080 [Spirochaetia bacterium]|nr:hypothetical protein [Spirochaetia bacterium]
MTTEVIGKTRFSSQLSLSWTRIVWMKGSSAVQGRYDSGFITVEYVLWANRPPTGVRAPGVTPDLGFHLLCLHLPPAVGTFLSCMSVVSYP